MRYSFLLLLFFSVNRLAAQDVWDLRRCVNYAMANNITVQQADIQARIAMLQSKLARNQLYPNLSFNTQAGYNFGRSIDPTSNQYTTNKVFFQSYGLQTGVTLFNWFSIKNNVIAAAKDQEAFRMDVEKARNDIALNVAAAYLQYLLSIEQANIAKVQIGQTTAQLENTRKLVEAGSLAEINAAQLEGQLAADSSNLVSAQGLAEQNKIQLVALLNLDETTPFSVATPDVNKIPLPSLSELQPEYVYQLALQAQPQQQSDSLRIIAGEYSVKSARGAMFPTLSGFASLGSNYASTYYEFGGISPTGKFDTLAVVPIGSTNYYAVTPGYTQSLSKPGYLKQIGNINFSQAVGVQLNVPIFNNRQLRTNFERSKLNLESAKLQRRANNLLLQQNIYTAYSNAATALEKYNANTKAVSIQQYALDLAQKRFDVGMLSTFDYITIQNNLTTAKINQVYAKYDFIFKLKVLEFYKGNGVQL